MAQRKNWYFAKGLEFFKSNSKILVCIIAALILNFALNINFLSWINS